MTFIKGTGDWAQYRKLPNCREIDFHRSDPRSKYGPPEDSYENVMAQVWDDALAALKKAQADGIDFLLLVHGSSTSRPGATTSRSQVRKLMKGKEATPFLIRRKCIEHATVFVAAIRRAGQMLAGSSDIF